MSGRVLLGVRILAALVAIALAVALAVFAGDVLAASSTMKRDDLRFRVAPDARGLWKVEGRTPRLTSVLRLQDDLAWRKAALRFQLSRARANLQYDPSRTTTRAAAQAAIAEAEREKLDTRQASEIANFSAILAYEEAVGDPQNGPMLLRRAVSEFRRSVGLDQSNEAAKFNLELLLRLLEPDAQQRRDRLGVGTGGDKSLGAAAAREGAGY